MIINEETSVNQINSDSKRLMNEIKSLYLPENPKKSIIKTKKKSCQRCEKNEVKRTCQNCFPLRWFCLVCDDYIHSLESKRSHIVNDVTNDTNDSKIRIIIEKSESFEVLNSKNRKNQNISLDNLKISNESVLSVLGKESNLIRNLINDYEKCILSLFNQNETKESELKTKIQHQSERILQLNNSLFDYESIFDEISSRFISIEEEYRKLILDLKALNKNKTELEKENKSLLVKINHMKTKSKTGLLGISQRNGINSENKNRSYDYNCLVSNDKYVNRVEKIEKAKNNHMDLVNEESNGFNYDYDYNSYNIHKNKTRKVN